MKSLGLEMFLVIKCWLSYCFHVTFEVQITDNDNPKISNSHFCFLAPLCRRQWQSLVFPLYCVTSSFSPHTDTAVEVGHGHRVTKQSRFKGELHVLLRSLSLLALLFSLPSFACRPTRRTPCSARIVYSMKTAWLKLNLDSIQLTPTWPRPANLTLCRIILLA